MLERAVGVPELIAELELAQAVVRGQDLSLAVEV